MEIFEQIEEILSGLNSTVERLSVRHCKDTILSESVAISAFVKSYEFNLAVNKATDENAYFMTSVLRGICEDYIVLKFLWSEINQSKDQVMELKLYEEIYQSSIAQWNFFSKYHTDQILYYHDTMLTDEVTNRNLLRGLMTNFPVRGNASMPSVFFMAERSGLEDLYRYLYHATSSLVHFNPRILLRMGWGELPEFSFSVKNFHKYYKHFSSFYGAYLFVELCDWMMDKKIIDKEIETVIQQLKFLLQDEKQWPALVTFEEMNIGTLQKNLLYKAPNE
ncbi:hypothetical protein B1R32_11915 [Abditibacterium utsteinense]|uniref:Uncharacterized protein n=1 Tax=Abditibacterium utsteinense TaxID=1960156 RepID=A0A2S8SQ00_9BACT|nr:DUF5677 domain-containing protein [Abditibacterium utsteinense]PQV62875.1 hypothetical protein B1R32_11915 [Abditibacterium utsteinense]